MTRKTILLAAVTLPLVACANQQPAETPEETTTGTPARVAQFGAFTAWDANDDGELTKAEFEARLTERTVYNDLDGDADGELTDLEFRTGLYNAWDVNGDERVDVYEYRHGSGAWFADRSVFGRFEDWDADGDQELTLVELRQIDLPMWSLWDRNDDDQLDDVEFTTGMWRAWDLDGDDVVDLYEYARQSDS